MTTKPHVGTSFCWTPEEKKGKTVQRPMALYEQADGKSRKPNGYHQFIKKKKLRVERRRAKLNPECQPMYRAYRGWEL